MVKNGRIKCPDCGRVYASSYMLKQHRDTPMCDPERDNGICAVCGESFKSEKGAVIHYRKSHSERFYKEEKTGEFDCPSCDKSLETKGGRSSHHKQVHGESLIIEKTSCNQCGEEYEYNPNQNHGDFCSGKCMQEYQVGENNPMFGQGHKVSGENNGMYGKTPATKGKTHSEEAKEKMRGPRPSIAGENHPKWVGGHDYFYGDSWTESLKEDIRERDGYECCECSVSQSELDYSLHVHHKIPFRMFGTEKHERANDPANLMSLCVSCHTRKDNLIIQAERRAAA